VFSRTGPARGRSPKRTGRGGSIRYSKTAIAQTGNVAGSSPYTPFLARRLIIAGCVDSATNVKLPRGSQCWRAGQTPTLISSRGASGSPRTLRSGQICGGSATATAELEALLGLLLQIRPTFLSRSRSERLCGRSPSQATAAITESTDKAHNQYRQEGLALKHERSRETQ
jgi:hypothetical protein